jgi:hypothetical protein
MVCKSLRLRVSVDCWICEFVLELRDAVLLCDEQGFESVCLAEVVADLIEHLSGPLLSVLRGRGLWFYRALRGALLSGPSGVLGAKKGSAFLSEYAKVSEFK